MALTAAEQAELDQLEKQYGSAAPAQAKATIQAPKATGGLTPAEEAELAQLEAQHGGQDSGWGVGRVAHAALDGVGRALNEAGGIVRTGLGAAADAGVEGYNQSAGKVFGEVARKRQGISGDDFVNALKGQGLSSAEIMNKLGVPEGGSIHSPGLPIPFTSKRIGEGDISARDAAGFASDVATDPMMWIGAGEAKLAAQAAEGGLKGLAAKAMLKANNVVNAPMNAIAGTGKYAYKSGLKGIDAVAEMYGKKPVSDLLFNEGITGTKHQILEKMNDLGDRELAARNKILDAGDTAVTGGYEPGMLSSDPYTKTAQAGTLNPAGEVSMKDSMKPTRDYIAKLRAKNDPNLQTLADQLEEKANAYEARDRVHAVTPIERTQSKVSTLDLPLQGSEYTPVQVKQGGPVEIPGLPVKQPSPLGSAAGAPTVLPPEWSVANVPSSIEKAGPTALQQTSTGPMQILEEGGMQRAGPAIEQNGVLPSTGSGYKTTAAAEVPESQWKNMGYVDAANKGTMGMQAGLRQGTEDAIGRSLGDEAKQALIGHNEKLGRILTTQDRLRLEAAQAGNKDLFTTVDGALVHASPASLVTKKMADALKTTWMRTKGGKLAYDFGSNPLLRAGGRAGELDLSRQLEQPDPESQYNFIRPPNRGY